MEDEVGKMCARLSRELNSHLKAQKTEAFGLLLEDEIGKMCTIL